MFLIDAALNAGVERFIPADYGGSLSRRMPGDPLDRGQSAAINRLQQCESRGMAYTVFACGILYERFCPGGMKSANIGQSSGASEEGDYLVNIRSMRSQIPYDASGRPAMISVTAAQDVGHFIVAALDLPQRPREFRIRGDRMNASDLVRVAEMMRGAPGCFLLPERIANDHQGRTLSEHNIMQRLYVIASHWRGRPITSKRLFVFTCSSLPGRGGLTSRMRTSTAWSISPL